MEKTLCAQNGYGFGTDCIKPYKLIDFLINHSETLQQITNKPINKNVLVTLNTYINAERPAIIRQSESEYPAPFAEKLQDFTKCFSYNQGNDSALSYRLLDLVAQVISKEIEITIKYYNCTTESPDDYILFPYDAPWWYFNAEKELTEHTLKQKLKKYMAELGVKEYELNDVTAFYYTKTPVIK